MSYGKLNILQHKSWNVWNRDNIEKVLRDERLNREEEDKKRKRRDEVESESRTLLLRSKRSAEECSESGASARGALIQGSATGATPTLLSLSDKFSAPESAPHVEGGGMEIANTGADVVSAREHKGFSLFAGMEQQLSATASGSAQGTQNEEAEQDKRKEKEKFDRQWGLVGLGQDSITGQMASSKPWYASSQPPSAPTFTGLGQASTTHGAVPFGIALSVDAKEAREERKKALADPAAQMHKYLHKTREHKEEKKKKSKRDGQGRRHREREGREGSAGQLSEAEKRAKLEKLRSERLAREAAERTRVAQIMGGVAPSSSRHANPLPDDYRSGYSSGFAAFHGGLVRDKHAPQHSQRSRYPGR